ncbi:MAG TPA: response regulator [Cyanophyceae cyanobacterium]
MSSATILIIENDLDVRENLVDLLTFEGYNMISAAGGEEGIELAIAHLPDLIICDVMMPGMNGFEVAEAIRQNRSTKLIRFIFLSAKVEKVSIRTGMIYADDYLLKPFERTQLLEAIAAQLERAAAVKKFLVDFTDILRQEVREEIGRKFEDRVGNALNRIAGCFTLLAEATTSEDKEFAIEAGLHAIAEIYAIWLTYQRTRRS